MIVIEELHNQLRYRASVKLVLGHIAGRISIYMISTIVDTNHILN